MVERANADHKNWLIPSRIFLHGIGKVSFQPLCTILIRTTQAFYAAIRSTGLARRYYRANPARCRRWKDRLWKTPQRFMVFLLRVLKTGCIMILKRVSNTKSIKGALNEEMATVDYFPCSTSLN